MKTYYFCFYEAANPADTHRLADLFESEQDTIAGINASYKHALEQGYDSKDETWAVICNRRTKNFNDKGEFMSETKERSVCCYVQYSFYEEAFVEVH